MNYFWECNSCGAHGYSNLCTPSGSADPVAAHQNHKRCLSMDLLVIEECQFPQEIPRPGTQITIQFADAHESVREISALRAKAGTCITHDSQFYFMAVEQPKREDLGMLCYVKDEDRWFEAIEPETDIDNYEDPDRSTPILVFF